MRVLFAFLLSFAFVVSAKTQNIYHSDIMQLARETGSLFPFGVASADPGPNSVLLWPVVPILR